MTMKHYRIRLMRTIIPGVWSVCAQAKTVQALDADDARMKETAWLLICAKDKGSYITAQEQ